MRFVIFANGELEETGAQLRFWLGRAAVVIAADGGTYAALRAGVTPSHIIGDIDSLSEDMRHQLAEAGTRFHVSPAEKDETDLELALTWAAEQPGCEEIVVLGAFGGRPDQELANLLLLALPVLQRRRVLMVKGLWTVQLLHGGDVLDLEGQTGDRLSLIPLGGPARGVSTEGLAFPLREEVLVFGRARGVSNRFSAEHATIRLREGYVWCFHENRGAVDHGA
jgi:thiamine pyrophosphokinase